MDTTDPFCSLRGVVVGHSRDWSTHRRDAWLYGIVIGWGDAIEDVQRSHGWADSEVKRLKQLRRKFVEAERIVLALREAEQGDDPELTQSSGQ